MNSESKKIINSESKYGDDEKFEPWTDVNIFFPIASKLVDPLYNLGLTPNMVTILSTIFTFLSIYFLHLDKRIHAVISYIFGYILDCVDGKMARKYSMGSDFGMVLDCTSDTISNLCLLAYLIALRKFNLKFAIQLSSIFIFIYLLSIINGLNEAISSYKKMEQIIFMKFEENNLKEKVVVLNIF
jgi:phosphatidylglycerophosphate synthase